MRRSSRSTVVALLVLLLPVLGACGGDDDDDQPAEAGARSEAGSRSEAAEGEDAPDAEAVVELLDAGSEPRQELRFELREGQEFRARMTTLTKSDMSVDGQALPSTPLPPTEIVIAGKIDDVADGVASYSFTYERLGAVAAEGVDPAVVAQYDTALEKVQGLRGTGSIDDRGKAGKSTLDTSAITDPALKSTLDSVTSQVTNLTVPFPVDAVGAGARWRVVRRAVQNGITIDSSSTYTLRSREGDRYVLGVDQTVTAPPGRANLPGLDGGTADIVDYEVTSSGEVAGDLTNAFPESSAISGGGDIEMKVTKDGETANLVQKIDLQVTLAPDA